MLYLNKSKSIFNHFCRHTDCLINSVLNFPCVYRKYYLNNVLYLMFLIHFYCKTIILIAHNNL